MIGEDFKRALFCLVVGVAVPLLAVGSSYEGVVTNVSAYNGAVYFIVGNGAFGPGGAGSCPTGTGMVFSIDPSSPLGQVQIAMAVTARTTGGRVFALGNGVCSTGSFYPPGLSEGLVGVDLK